MISTIKKIVKAKIPFILPIIKTGISVIKQHISKRYIKRLLKERKAIYLELGAGDKKGEGAWVTIDITKQCDIYWDLGKGLPFPNKSITKIYSSHFFEHLSFKEGQQILDECMRVLIPGGTFSICVPNAKLYIDAYIKSKTLDRNQYFSHKPAYNNTTQIDYVNYTAFMDGHHKYMFDKENLLNVLKSKGFKNVHLRKFDPNLDLKVRDFESIYAEAVK